MTQSTPDIAVEGPAEDGPVEPKRNEGLRSFVEWVAVIAGALVIAVVIKTFLFQAFYIPSESMVPTLKIGDRVLVNKLSYDLHDVNRGDIIVFERPPDAPKDDIPDLIKRVVGLPGDTIESKDGDVYINGDLLKEPYLPADTPTDRLERQKVPEGQVFVMGDNRTHSLDSRSFGPIDQDLIVGRAFIRIWPFSHLGGL